MLIIIELEWLCTAPEYQRQGIGKALVQSGIRIAEAAGLPMEVMATPNGLKLYESLGFRRVETLTHDCSKWGYNEPHMNYFLVRDVTSI